MQMSSFQKAGSKGEGHTVDDIWESPKIRGYLILGSL